eukprot:5674000-Prymnesium_polylepis.1
MVTGCGSISISPRDQTRLAERLAGSTVFAAARRACSRLPFGAFLMRVGTAATATESVASSLAGEGRRFQNVEPRRLGPPKAAAADHSITS